MALIPEKKDARGRVRTWSYYCDENGCVFGRTNLTEREANITATSHLERHRLSCGHLASSRCNCDYCEKCASHYNAMSFDACPRCQAVA